MAWGERYEEHQLPFPDAVVWDALIAVLEAPGGGFQNVTSDTALRRVTADVPKSFWSWGERVTVEVAWVSADRTVVRMRSVARVRLNLLAAGRNAANLERILEALGATLRATSAPAARLVTVFCPQCRTTNPGDATRCSACGAELAPPPAPVFAPTPPRGRGRRIAITLAGLAVLVVGAGVATYAVTQAGESGPAFDPAQGARLAEAALIDAADLPGSGWSVVPHEDDRPTAPEGASAACTAFFEDTTAFPDQFDAALAGRATRDFERTEADGTGIPTSIGVDIRVLDAAASLEGVADRYAALFARPEAVPCLEQTYEQPGMTITVERVDASSAVPEGGAALAFDITLGVQDVRLVVRIESYLWTLDNAIVEVDASGVRGAPVSDAARTAVVRTVDLLQGVADQPPLP